MDYLGYQIETTGDKFRAFRRGFLWRKIYISEGCYDTGYYTFETDDLDEMFSAINEVTCKESKKVWSKI